MKAYKGFDISVFLWLSLFYDLRKRGKGNRESGAFLLSKHNCSKIKEYICFDDLDPNCLTGRIEFSHKGYSKLWEYLRNNNLKVVADVHTHPSKWTGQSEHDRNNPMISVAGHLAFIVPYFATKNPFSFIGIGVYEYLGGYKWKVLNKNSIKITMI